MLDLRKKKTKILCACFFVFTAFAAAPAAKPLDDSRGEPEDRSCTVVTVGRLASVDGSVMTSHTCDSYTGRTWIDIVQHQKHGEGDECSIYMKTDNQLSPNDRTFAELHGTIPQVPETNGYVWGFYPIMNEHQLAIGESTFHGKEEMISDAGLLNCYELTRLLSERCKTAREAIKVAGELLEEHGYNDGGEALTFCDPKEAWLFEVVGPGKGKKGAVWVAKRVPDGQISVYANMSRIMEVDLTDPDTMASANVYSTAREMGLWDPDGSDPFRFCYAYASRKSMAGRRREWRAYSMLAPSCDFDPNGENFPLFIKPDKKVCVADIARIFADTYEGTEYDMTKFMLVEGEDGKMVKSPYANPFMAYDEMPLWKINGGWNGKGERTLARSYCVYAHITQSRDWLPDEIGGMFWFGLDNPAMTCYTPIYCCQKNLPPSYMVGGENLGRAPYSRQSAWWAYNRVSHLAAHRWGDTRHDVAAVRDPLQKGVFEEQNAIEKEALGLYADDPAKAVDFLSKYSSDLCEKVEKLYWKLGDDLWGKYDGKF